MNSTEEEERAKRRRQEERDEMIHEFGPVILFFAGCALLLFVIVQAITGFIDAIPSFNENNVEIAQTDVGVVRLEPVSLDCHGRIEAVVPVEAENKRQLAGRLTWSTDRMNMDVHGQLLTCLEDEAVAIDEDDGEYTVTIDASRVHFEEATIDAVETAESVETNQGTLSGIVDAIPFVNLDSELTSEGYAFGQIVVDNECKEAAWGVTQEAIINAYKVSEAERLGIDPDDITVEFDGTPDFTPRTVPDELFGDVEMEVINERVVCLASEGGATQAPVSQ